MTQSKMLTEFYNNYHDWASEGAPEHPDFHRGVGLCNCYLYFLHDHKLPELTREARLDEMEKQFLEAGLNPNYPFGHDAYQDAFANDTMHLCPVRMAWVKSHLWR